MPVHFETPESQQLYSSLVAKHGKPLTTDLLRLRPRETHRFWVSPQGHLTASSQGKNSYTLTRWDHEGGRAYNVESKLAKAPAGSGTKMLARQVLAARQAALSRIHVNHAAGLKGHSVYNGYYTWPRLGFNGPVSHPDFPGHADAHSIFSTEEGAAKWKERGGPLEGMEFDPHPDSEHSKRLLAYMKSKGIKV